MVTSLQLAEAAMGDDALLLRSLVQDVLFQVDPLSALGPPETDDVRLQAVAASLVELLAERTGQAPPTWTGAVGPAPEPVFLVRAAGSMRRLRRLCLTEAPDALRRRRVFAPPNYLVMA
jgi:hypothetical protein